MIRLYSAEVCPFAQRTRALCVHLGIPFELRPVDLEDRDPELLALCPTGRVPLVVDGDLVLYESQIVNEYLADVHGWSAAWADAPALRARQRLAMKQWDATVVGLFYRSLGSGGRIAPERTGELSAELDQLDDTARAMDSVAENLLGLHCAPFWARMDWMRAHSDLPGEIDRRPHLVRFLDAAVALPAVGATLPERASTVRRYTERFVGADA